MKNVLGYRLGDDDFFDDGMPDSGDGGYGDQYADVWGDEDYCYIPKKVLPESDPELVALLHRRAHG